MILIGVGRNGVAEEPQMPLGDRRLSRSPVDFLFGDVGSKRDSQNVSETPLVERVESLAGPHRQVPHF